MSATASRTTQGTVEPRQLLLAIGMLILAVALLVAVGATRQASVRSTTAPAAVTSPTDHDHGSSSASSASANDFAKAHAPKSAPDSSVLVVKTKLGNLVYTGIPYPAPDPATRGTGGSNGTRFAQ